MSRRLVLGLYWVGLGVLVLGLGQLHATVLAPTPYHLLDSSQLRWELLLLAVLVSASYAVGLPELVTSRAAAVGVSLLAVGMSSVTVSLAQLALGEQLLPRSVLGLLVLLTPIYSWLSWITVVDVNHRGQQRVRLLVVATVEDDVRALETDLALRPELNGRVVGVLTPDEIVNDQQRDLLVERALALSASVVVLDVASQARNEVVQQAGRLHQLGLRIRSLSLFYEEWLGKLPLSELERVSLLFDIGELHRQQYVRARRVLDVGFALAGTVVLVGLLPLVITANAVANRGPLLFRQERVGKGGRSFVMFKFRTMSGADTSSWTTASDDRVTPFGRVMRRTHLDELPQVLNVLRGELSVVGPRPEQCRYVEELRAKVPYYDVRHLVRPGLTGWAQVKYGYTSHASDALEKLQYDMYYLRRQGLHLDLRIIARTFRAVLRGDGR